MEAPPAPHSKLLFTGPDWNFETLGRVFEAVREIGEGELGINHIYIIGWAYLAFDVNDVFIFKAAHYMGNGIGFTNIG